MTLILNRLHIKFLFVITVFFDPLYTLYQTGDSYYMKYNVIHINQLHVRFITFDQICPFWYWLLMSQFLFKKFYKNTNVFSTYSLMSMQHISHHGHCYYILLKSQNNSVNNEKKFKKLIMELSNPQDAPPIA